MKAIILARVSTEEQKEAGNSLPAQIKRLEDYCDRKGFNVVREYSFDESAYKAKRDEFDKILDDIKGTKEKLAICFDKVDRLSRDVFDKRVALLYEKAVGGEIELHFVSDAQVINSTIGAADKFAFSMKLGLSKYYSDAIGDNVRRAIEQKLRNGEFPQYAPIGYLNKRDEKDNADIIPDPDRSHFIQWLFKMYASGNESLDTLQERLSKQGFRSKSNKIVGKSHLHRVLKNPFYYGVMRFKGKLYSHRYEKLISRTLYEKAQETARERSKTPYKAKSGDYIFKGLITCADCDCRVTGEKHKQRYVYYSCTNSKKVCKREYIREEELLEQVGGVFRSFKLPKDWIEGIKKEIKKLQNNKCAYHTKTLNVLRKQYDTLQNRTDKLLDVMLDGSITKDEHDKKLKKLKEEQTKINIEIEEHTDADKNFYIASSTLLSLAQRAQEIFESSEPHEKRQLLNFVFQNLQMKDKKLVFKLKEPFQALVSNKDRSVWLRGRDSNPRPID